MDSIDQALKAALPTLVKWQKRPWCPKCSATHQANPHWFRGLIMVFQRRTFIEQHYCPGKVNPTVDVRIIAGGELHREEVNLPCFGLEREHLHCQCNGCHYSFFMETYDSRS